MGVVTRTVQPNDFLGTLWALTGVRDLAVVIDGTAGCSFFHMVNASPGAREALFGRFLTTALEEDDVTLGGGEEKLAAALRAACGSGAAAVAVVSNPVSTLIGLDAVAVAARVEAETGIPVLVFQGGGWRGSADDGAGEAMLALSRRFATPGAPPSGAAPGVNLLGPTAETFNWPADEAELRRLLSLLGLEVGAVLAWRTSTAEIARAGTACLSVVTHPAGLPAARHLAEAHGVPYIYGLPFGRRGTLEWLERVAALTGRDLPPGLAARELASFPSLSTLARLTEGSHRGRAWRVAVSAPYPVAAGLTRLAREDWRLEVAAVRLAGDPGPAAVAELEALGAARVVVDPGGSAWREALAAARPDILLGSAADSALAPEVPVHVRVAAPAPDTVALYDGTPLVGWRGYAHLTQTLANALRRPGGAAAPAERAPGAVAGDGSTARQGPAPCC